MLDLTSVGQNLTVEQWYFGLVARIGTQIGLVEDDDRGRPALRGEHERALEAPQVEVAVQAGHEEHAVRVGGHHLLGRGRARHLA